jgi:hypothetical protein
MLILTERQTTITGPEAGEKAMKEGYQAKQTQQKLQMQIYTGIS